MLTDVHLSPVSLYTSVCLSDLSIQTFLNGQVRNVTFIKVINYTSVKHYIGNQFTELPVLRWVITY